MIEIDEEVMVEKKTHTPLYFNYQCCCKITWLVGWWWFIFFKSIWYSDFDKSIHST